MKFFQQNRAVSELSCFLCSRNFCSNFVLFIITIENFFDPFAIDILERVTLPIVQWSLSSISVFLNHEDKTRKLDRTISFSSPGSRFEGFIL